MIKVCLLLEVITLIGALFNQEEFGVGLSILMCLIPLLILSLFYKLELELSSESIRLKFGIGVIKKSFVVSEIVNATKVTSPFWVGYGIRIHPSYTLYNIEGSNAIEIALKGRSRKYRIGTDDPDKIYDYIKSVIINNKP